MDVFLEKRAKRPTVLVTNVVALKENFSPLPLSRLMFMDSSAKLTGKRNIEGREEESCVINSLDASYVLFKRGVTTIYDRGCRYTRAFEVDYLN